MGTYALSERLNMRFIALVPLALVGCASVTDRAPDYRTTYLICDNTIPLDINHDGQTAVVRNRDRQQVTLKRVPAITSVRYEGSGLAVMRTEETYIFIARDGSTHGCALLRR